MVQINEAAGRPRRGRQMTLSAGVRLDYRSWTV